MFSIALDDEPFDVAPQEMISSWQIWTSGRPLSGSAMCTPLPTVLAGNWRATGSKVGDVHCYSLKIVHVQISDPCF